MIVVTKVDVVKSEYSRHMIRHMSGDPTFQRMLDHGEKLEEVVKYWEEVVTPQCFINSWGEKVYIGLSDQAQQVLGLPFECFEKCQDGYNKIKDLEKENLMNQKQYQEMLKEIQTQKAEAYEQRETARECFKMLSEYRHAGVLKRLKYLFTGRI